ncbi:hypothetical protein DFH06DRAFT_1199349 [Mycena polygramma]|nr:hypothetical protein DFH06DRAFT_1199349 [Mycena polygramma]
MEATSDCGTLTNHIYTPWHPLPPFRHPTAYTSTRFKMGPSISTSLSFAFALTANFALCGAQPRWEPRPPPPSGREAAESIVAGVFAIVVVLMVVSMLLSVCSAGVPSDSEERSVVRPRSRAPGEEPVRILRARIEQLETAEDMRVLRERVQQLEALVQGNTDRNYGAVGIAAGPLEPFSEPPPYSHSEDTSKRDDGSRRGPPPGWIHNI